MPTFGVTSTGFSSPNVQDLIALMQADQLANISASLDVSSDSIFGQMNGIYANYLAQAWEALAGCYNGFDPDKSEAVMLTMLAKLTGTARAVATKSTALCTVTASIGTVLIAGTHYASVTGNPGIRFTPVTTFTASAGVTPNVLFQSEFTGPVQAPVGQLTVIATAVVGWTGITNLAAALGSLAATDAQLRLTRQQELTRAGSSTIDAIRAKLVVLLAAISGASVTGFNNVTDVTDANSLPPHSFEMVVWDPLGVFTDAQIAQVIWDNKPAGIRAYGSNSGNAVDKTGATQVVSFTRAVPVPIYVSANLTRRPTFVSNIAFAQSWRDGLTGGIVVKDSLGNTDVILTPFATGVTVTSYDLTLATQGLGAKINTLTFGISPSPVSSADIAIGIRQIATFSTSNMALTP